MNTEKIVDDNIIKKIIQLLLNYNFSICKWQISHNNFSHGFTDNIFMATNKLVGFKLTGSYKCENGELLNIKKNTQGISVDNKPSTN